MRLWYYGSEQFFEELREGSTITPERFLAEIFSHRPSLVMRFERNGIEEWRHNGKVESGYLYEIQVPSNDSIYPHPTSVMKPDLEWLIRRPLKAILIGRTAILEVDRLSEAEERECLERIASQNIVKADATP